MIAHQIRALLIEDDPDDVMLLKDSLADIGMGKIKLEYVDRLSKGLILLSQMNYDVILLDLNLPDSHGLDTLIYTMKRFPKIPVVVFSGLADEAITVEAVRRGAQDYLIKGAINGPLVLRVLRYAIERKQIEAVLRVNEDRYRTLVEASPNGITLADLEGNLLLCNQQAARLHGYENPEAMLGIPVFKLFAPMDRQQTALNTQKALDEGLVTNVEYTMLRKDGTKFPAEISTVLLRNSSGVPSGFINITRDISERRQLIAAEKRLAMLKEEFISKVSADLRIPLQSMMGYLDLLRSGKISDSAKQNEFLIRASRDANYMLEIVNELQDFSLLERGQLILNRENVDIIKLIANVLRSLQGQAQAKKIALSFAPMNPSLFAEVDPSRIRRVVVKLVENAIKSSEVSGKVYVTGKSMNGNININVIDEGCGLSAEQCSRIFEKYYQDNEAPDESSLGVRLGLYLAKEIINAHGGTLSVSSQSGAGSTFTITLPKK